MTSENNLEQFKNAVNRALNEFEHRLNQQRLFQIQNTLLKKLQQEIIQIDYGASENIKSLSIQYENFYTQLNETGRSYESVVAEKTLVDTYSAFEKFLSDCFYSLYEFFPKFLGTDASINIEDLFIESDIELCKKNIIESKIKNFIQANNIKAIIGEFKSKKTFNLKELAIDENELELLHEISLIRNLIVHNNSIVNRIYIESVKRLNHTKYQFNDGETVLDKLDGITHDLKTTVERMSNQIVLILNDDAIRLYQHHKNM